MTETPQCAWDICNKPDWLLWALALHLDTKELLALYDEILHADHEEACELSDYYPVLKKFISDSPDWDRDIIKLEDRSVDRSHRYDGCIATTIWSCWEDKPHQLQLPPVGKITDEDYCSLIRKKYPAAPWPLKERK